MRRERQANDEPEDEQAKIRRVHGCAPPLQKIK